MSPVMTHLTERYGFAPFSFEEDAAAGPSAQTSWDSTSLRQSVTTKVDEAATDRTRQQTRPLLSGRLRVMPAGMTARLSLSYNAGTLGSRVSHQQRIKGETMVDLSGYKDLTKPPESASATATLTPESESYTLSDEKETTTMSSTTTPRSGFGSLSESSDMGHDEAYAEYSSNVRTLLKLVNDLPAEVTKQSGAQVIRLTMEAMGISMENVLSDAQSAQSDLLDSVRSNIKKIEEYKTVIRKLEGEIKTLQSKANELSEIIDLFILSNTSSNATGGDSY